MRCRLDCVNKSRPHSNWLPIMMFFIRWWGGGGGGGGEGGGGGNFIDGIIITDGLFEPPLDRFDI